MKPLRTFTSCLARWLAGVPLVAACLLLGACETLNKTPQVDVIDAKNYQRAPLPAPPAPQTVAANAPPPTGSLYQVRRYRPLFEDYRARLVGDIVTIQIVENVNASQKSTSAIGKTGSVTGGATAFPFLSQGILNKTQIGAKTDNEFSGTGNTDTANTFTGSITATVIDVLPNGNLVIVGDKQIGLNQNVDVLRFSGTIDPRTIQSGNIVSSLQVADVRVESRGRGAQGEAQTMGWLSRFFLTLSPF